MERGYAALLIPRLEAASLVVLGTIGDVTPAFPPSERRGRVPWALARFDIERVLKGPRARRRLTLIGPSPASKRLPRPSATTVTAQNSQSRLTLTTPTAFTSPT